TLPLSIQADHPVFHVSLLRKHNPNTISHRQQATPVPITIQNEEHWEYVYISLYLIFMY
ncbi:uncharacterized protein VP01_5916g1, partial [Puccinia sorghi]